MQTVAYTGARQTLLPQFVSTDQFQSLTDEQLINHCRVGNRQAFDALFTRYERSIFHLSYRLAGNYDDAHDIAAETFLRIYRSIGTFQCAVTLPAWINRIVVNVYFDTRRHAHRHPSVSLDALVEKAGDGLFYNESDERESPQAAAEKHELRTVLEKAIASLPDYQRVMVNLFHNEGRTYEEISQMKKIPVGTVKSRLNRARLALREILGPQTAALSS